ncbi:MAG: hypothetical protein ACRD8O_19460 [Bryobacteraceae bacterium]
MNSQALFWTVILYAQTGEFAWPDSAPAPVLSLNVPQNSIDINPPPGTSAVPEAGSFLLVASGFGLIVAKR